MKLKKMAFLIAAVTTVIGCAVPVQSSAAIYYIDIDEPILSDESTGEIYFTKSFAATGKSFDSAKVKVDAKLAEYYNKTVAPYGFTYSASDIAYEKARARFVKAHPYAFQPEDNYITAWVTNDGDVKLSDELYWQKKGDYVSDSDFNIWVDNYIDGRLTYIGSRPSNWYHKDGNKKKPMGYYDVPDWFGWKDYLWTVKNVTYRDRTGKHKLKAKKDIYGYKVTVRFHKS